MRAPATTRFVEHLDSFARLWAHPSASREHLLRFQRRKLRFLIRDAYACVPYYRELFDAAGVRPDEIRDAADLARLPITSKQDLRSRPVGDVIARGVDPEKLLVRYTTGSTGEPTRVRMTEFEDRFLGAFHTRMERSLGIRARDRSVGISSPGVPTDHKTQSSKRFRNALGIQRNLHLDCLRCPREVAKDLAAIGPEVVHGYPGVLAEVASLWSEVAAGAPYPRVVWAGGETLTPAMRTCIEAGFDTRVWNTYRAREFKLLAWECATTGHMHVCDDSAIVEILRDGRPAAPGESGDVVVTGLHTHAMPYIRYALGDIATRGDDACDCGLPFSTITRIRGRAMDYCVLPNGRKMHHWEIIPMAFWDMLWHKRYQLVQETHERFVLKVVRCSEPAVAEIEMVEKAVREKLGSDCEFHIDFVAEIAYGRGGKYQLCRSEVAAVAPTGADQGVEA